MSDFVLEEPNENDVLTLSYTSGTTGDPKGVKITHKQLMTNVSVMQENDPDALTSDDSILSYLPAAHGFE